MSVQSFDEISLSFINDISSTKTYYKMQDSELDPPTAPTTNPPTGWSATEPAHTTGASEKMYTVICTEFSDGSFSYSEVSESASYTAVNEAQSTADQAISDAADAAKTATNYIGTDETLDAVIIGDMTGETLGKHTLINSKGVSIRDGDTELARFGQNRLDLGSADTESEISFNGGLSKIYNNYKPATGLSREIIEVPRGDLVLQAEFDSSDYSTLDYSRATVSIMHDRNRPYNELVYYTCPVCFRKLAKDDVDLTTDPWTAYCPRHGQVNPYANMDYEFGPTPTGADYIDLRVRRTMLQDADPPVLGGFAPDAYFRLSMNRTTNVFDPVSSTLRAGADSMELWADRYNSISMDKLGGTKLKTLLLSLDASAYAITNPAEFRRALNSDKYAAITVQYPSDSKCYCENEELGIIYEALDEIGSYEFVIPSNQLGTWKITIVNSEKTATKTVTLSEDERTAHVNMSYWNGELFDSGDQFTDITGGWKIANYRSVTDTVLRRCDIGTRLYVLGSGGRDAAIITEEPVDMTEFTKLVVEYDRSLTSNAAYFGVFRSNVEPLNAQTANNIANLAFNSSKDMLTLDITSITGMMYPVLYTATASSTHYADVTKMYMLR